MNIEESLIFADKLNGLEIQLGDLFKKIDSLGEKLSLPNQSEEINELAAALAKAQSEIEIAGKKETNPFFKSKYADLAEIIRVSRPALTKNGLAVMQQIIDNDGATFLNTILTHSSGQWIKSTLRILPTKSDIQSLGSCITYNRRYAYAALLAIGVADEDDDGEAAVYSQRQVVAKGTALNTKYNPKDNVQEVITNEQREELEYELASYPDLTEMILDGFKIRSIADMPKNKFMPAVERIRQIKQVREGK